MATSATVMVVWRILEGHRWLSSRHFEDVRWFGSEGPPTPESLPHTENSARTLTRGGSLSAVIVWCFTNLRGFYARARVQQSQQYGCSCADTICPGRAAEGAGNIRGWRCRLQARRLDAFSRQKHAFGGLGQWFRPENAVESCGRDQKKTRHALEAFGLGCGWPKGSKKLFAFLDRLMMLCRSDDTVGDCQAS